MRRILSVDNMRESDAATIAGGIPGRELMWRAGEAIYDAVLKEHGWQGKTAIVCGSGNNAGDGYVLALLLHKAGHDCVICLTGDRFSEDGRYYYNQCVEAGIKVVDINALDASEKLVNINLPNAPEEPVNINMLNTPEEPVNINMLAGADIIVDCIYGTGFHGNVKSPLDKLIYYINTLDDVYIISVDINSGLNGDNGLSDGCIHSDLTVSIGDYQPGHFLNMAKDVMAKRINCPIGINPVHPPYHLYEEEDAARLFPERKNLSNKGSYGYIALIGGSTKYSGAVRLANMAASAMRCGSGVVTVAAPASLHNIIVSNCLESTFYPLDDNQGELVFNPHQIDELISHKKAIAFGMGIGRSKETASILMYILKKYDGTLIIDADGISDISDVGSECLLGTRAKIIMTPHLGEMARLTGRTIEEIQKSPIEIAREYAEKYQVTLLLKGPATIITDGSVVYITSKGCSGMATAGSGDVLSGIIGAIAGAHPLGTTKGENEENCSLMDIAACGALVNGMAGELAMQKYGDVSMIASDTVSFIPDVIKEIRRRKSW